MTEKRKLPALRGATRKKLIAHLEKEIESIAPDLKQGESYQLATQFKPESKPIIYLSKRYNSGAELGLTAFIPIRLLKDNELLATLKGLLEKANKQLSEAKSRDIQQTFFIIIDQGSISKFDVNRMQSALCQLAPQDCSDINFCYLVSPGRTPNVQEWTLPSGQSKHGEFIK
jgi:hypothetical protein